MLSRKEMLRLNDCMYFTRSLAYALDRADTRLSGIASHVTYYWSADPAPRPSGAARAFGTD